MTIRLRGARFQVGVKVAGERVRADVAPGVILTLNLQNLATVAAFTLSASVLRAAAGWTFPVAALLPLVMLE